ncbi:MAG: right-handed parallel beta-helix repeat-containing protein [Acidobacteria bacterium]|nr:right-handed parallel beta-helix repeat-containing protein [Acidobacteriota bacterium]
MLPLLFSLAIAIPQTGRLVLPAGVVDLTAELRIPAGAHDLVIVGHRNGTTLRLAPGFAGRAAIVCDGARNVRLASFRIEGRRETVKDRVGLPPSNVAFADFYRRNGILARGAEGLSIQGVSFHDIWGFAVLVNRSRRVRMDNIRVADSGGRNSLGRNNTTGGVLFEEGVEDFEVRRSTFDRVLGNGVWTHSNYGSPRNVRGLFVENTFHEIGRDALQVGHATEVRVERNTGDRIGYPFDAIDVENGATPVAIDTSGNVDHSVYTSNQFSELNGKCIDLDGFHDGQVTFNVCVNKGGPKSYPNGHFAIVVNNYNPDMRSENIVIADNTVDGAKFGGVFLIGTHHTVVRNKLLNLNSAHCNENAATYGCSAIQGEPDVLQAGIYLGRIAAEWAQKRADASRGHIIRENLITGYKMDKRCVMAAPGVALAESSIGQNVCQASSKE